MLLCVNHLFFYVSGEHATLPSAEIRAILQSEDFSYDQFESLQQTVCLQADINCLSTIARRGSLTRNCCIEIFRCKADIRDILVQAHEAHLTDYIGGGSFSVRVKKVDKKSTIDSNRLEREIGRIILLNTKEVMVRLFQPDKPLIGIITNNLFIFGVQLAKSASKGFESRKNRNRPFTHPLALSPKIARCMVNLSRAKPSSLILDPFCGTGSILIEAGLMGCHTIGSDVKAEMVKGSLKNLDFFAVPRKCVLIADARSLPFVKVESIATDPPYGRSSTTLGLSVRSVVSDFMANIIDMLPRGGYISLALPLELNVIDIGESLGYKCVESHLIREHKSLTRELAVMKRP